MQKNKMAQLIKEAQKVKPFKRWAHIDRQAHRIHLSEVAVQWAEHWLTRPHDCQANLITKFDFLNQIEVIAQEGRLKSDYYFIEMPSLGHCYFAKESLHWLYQAMLGLKGGACGLYPDDVPISEQHLFASALYHLSHQLYACLQQDQQKSFDDQPQKMYWKRAAATELRQLLDQPASGALIAHITLNQVSFYIELVIDQMKVHSEIRNQLGFHKISTHAATEQQATLVARDAAIQDAKAKIAAKISPIDLTVAQLKTLKPGDVLVSPRHIHDGVQICHENGQILGTGLVGSNAGLRALKLMPKNKTEIS